MSYHKMPNSKRNLRIYAAVALREFLAKGGTIARYDSKGERI
jgi:hypothetical protein